jgi:hypothetical protein
LDQRAGWLELKADLNDKLSVTNTYLIFPTFSMLDETCINLNLGAAVVRVGRLRNGFGFNDWSEHWYNAFIKLPIVRMSPMTPYYTGVWSFDAGIDARLSLGPVEIKTGLLDPKIDSWQIVPKNANYGMARVQSVFGPLILGANAMGKLGRTQDEDFTAYGLDFKWTAPRIMLRGELIRSVNQGEWSGGYYFDAFYRPAGMSRTQLGIRFQEAAFLGSAVTRQQTIGIRQLLTPMLAANLNYGFASGPGASGLKGWSFQIVTSLHF